MWARNKKSPNRDKLIKCSCPQRVDRFTIWQCGGLLPAALAPGGCATKLGTVLEQLSMLGDRIQIVGDDLCVTNPAFIPPRNRPACDQRGGHQAQSNRHRHRNAAGDRNLSQSRMELRHLTPLRRDRHGRRPNQNRLAVAQRAALPNTIGHSRSSASLVQWPHMKVPLRILSIRESSLKGRRNV
jgi:hypothetical protein